jgi:hypothetical protein
MIWQLNKELSEVHSCQSETQTWKSSLILSVAIIAMMIAVYFWRSIKTALYAAVAPVPPAAPAAPVPPAPPGPPAAGAAQAAPVLPAPGPPAAAVAVAGPARPLVIPA